MMAVPTSIALIISILMASKCITGNGEYRVYRNRYSNSSEENYFQPKSGYDRFHRRSPQNPTSNFHPENTSSELSREKFTPRPRAFVKNGGAINPACYGNLQSPINLLVRDSRRSIAPRLEIKGFTTKPAGVTLTNTGYSVVVKWLPSKGLPAVISGGVLRSTYIVSSAHFHWGRTDSSGSEHLIHNRRFSLELHVVCFNSKYGKR